MHGLGVMTWKTGKKYIGYFSNNKRYGLGYLITVNGDAHYGNFNVPLNDDDEDEI